MFVSQVKEVHVRRDYTLPTLLHRVLILKEKKPWSRFIINSTKMPCCQEIWDAIFHYSQCSFASQVNSKWFITCKFQATASVNFLPLRASTLVLFDLIKLIPNWFNIKAYTQKQKKGETTYRYIHIWENSSRRRRTKTEKLIVLHWDKLYVANLVIY